MQLEHLTHPLAIKWDTLEQKRAVVAILDKKGAVPILYRGASRYDRILVYPKCRERQDVTYTDTYAETIEIIGHAQTTITAEQFINDNR